MYLRQKSFENVFIRSLNPGVAERSISNRHRYNENGWHKFQELG